MLVLFMGLFRPDGLPVIVLIVPFGLLFVAFLSLWDLLRGVYRRYFTDGPEAAGPSRLGATVCGSTVLLLILQSLGQLTLRDIGTVIAIVAIGYLYLVRNRPSVARR